MGRNNRQKANTLLLQIMPFDVLIAASTDAEKAASQPSSTYSTLSNDRRGP